MLPKGTPVFLRQPRGDFYHAYMPKKNPHLRVFFGMDKIYWKNFPTLQNVLRPSQFRRKG